jgi:2-polyprenyl-3-methyl-5-hydroxy-6-metoxy-1,4-benzoquinol methylase
MPSTNLPQLPPLDARVPAWPRARMRPRACPWCGGEGPARWVRPDGLPVHACPRCAGYYVGYTPVADDLAALYASYYDQTYLRPAARRELLRELLARLPGADVRLRTLARHRPLRGARVLDAGCGVGTALRQYAAAGARVCGVDMDATAIAMLRDQYGFADVQAGDVLTLPLDGSFDVVLMYDVIEHPLEPLAWLRRATELLAPGGTLVLWTPNGAAVERDPACVTFRVDLEHLQYLAPETARRLAAELGLEVVHLETLGYPNLADRLPGLSRIGRLWRTLAFAARAAVAPHASDYNLFAILRQPIIA